MDILIQIGMEVFLIERALQDIFSVWFIHEFVEKLEAI
jgi:hypothetical protein